MDTDNQNKWKNICTQFNIIKFQDELNYQQCIEKIIFEDKLGWEPIQISSQLSLQLGARERLVPDIYLKKDEKNSLVVEVKSRNHIKEDKNINQLISYMKQLETSVGIYIGSEIEVYYKKIGDGSNPFLLMKLHFNEQDENGINFISLFKEKDYSIERVEKFKIEKQKNQEFQNKVDDLVKDIKSDYFKDILPNIVSSFFIEKGLDQNVVKIALDKIIFDVKLKEGKNKTHEEEITLDYLCRHSCNKKIKPNNGTVQRYAYNLIKQIIDKNYGKSYGQIYAIFGKKNHIEDIKNITEKRLNRWFQNPKDLITLIDGTIVAISNQWGMNGASKPEMDNLIKIANDFGIDTSFS
ncbi:MAG: type I restriction enzyme HsdR N-terminal domain-containing protein [Erysipelotrichales bacterium]|nr:type I restriction enzyme HsdR N-terminal domain-containing protein [Erysipelotrichales bacterium]